MIMFDAIVNLIDQSQDRPRLEAIGQTVNGILIMEMLTRGEAAALHTMIKLKLSHVQSELALTEHFAKIS